MVLWIAIIATALIASLGHMGKLEAAPWVLAIAVLLAIIL